ncbi:hypothetical protein [Pseudomonas sp. DY-1]|uniref:hypothetical protein n=1 Tax=Pseudomonas sp. DY-1 TaxID=1755504 RepID=UPI0013C51B9F|nr:hypothetical protein [Pseudomonas sp. DY-1]
MSAFDYIAPGVFKKSVFGCSKPSENYRLKSFMMLIGMGGISRGASTSIKKLETDFLMIPVQSPASPSISNVLAKFQGFSRSELDGFFFRSITKNHKLHQNIYGELKNAIGHHAEGSPVACFLYIYRLIEQTALCLPMVSIISKGGFNNTFDAFKQLVDGKAKSDLSVLKKYSENILDPAVGDSVAKLDFSRTLRPKQNVEVVKRFIVQANIVSETIDSIEIKYRNLDALIVGFRNQFFHYLFHERNLSITDIDSPDDFLKVCNPIFLNYFAFLYHDLVVSELTIWG